MTKKTFEEARRYINLNPKISVFDEIEQHYHQYSNSFVTFTKLDKIGINPLSKYDSNTKFNTPLGVYAYPSSFVLKTGIENLPYGKDFPFVTLFSIKGNLVTISSIYIQEIEKYIKKLISVFSIPEEAIKEIIVRSSSESNIPSELGSRFWFIMKEATKYISYDHSLNLATWNSVFRKIGIDAILDEGKRIIHLYEPTQAVVFTPKAIINKKRIESKIK